MHESKKLVFIAQVFISRLTAFLMTGIMGVLRAAFAKTGPSNGCKAS